MNGVALDSGVAVPYSVRRRVVVCLVLIGGVPFFLLLFFLTRGSSFRFLPIASLGIVVTMTVAIVVLASKLLFKLLEDVFLLEKAVHRALPAAGAGGETKEENGAAAAAEGVPTGVDALLLRLNSTMKEVEVKARQLEETNAKLKELDRLKSDFLSSVSHELRTPLTSIRSFSEILLNYTDVDAETRTRFLKIINSECERLTSLINNVLDIARIEAGRIVWNMGVMRLDRTLEKSVASTLGLGTDGKVRISLKIAAPLPEIFGDPDRIQQVAINLIGNAVKFSPEGSEVQVSGGPAIEPGMVEFSVHDQGPGIPLSQQHRLFGKFEQIHDPAEPKPVGTGLGLAISKEIIEVHGGRICVKSEPGKGSVFTVKLPAWNHQSEFRSNVDLWIRQADRSGFPLGVFVIGTDGAATNAALSQHRLRDLLLETVRSNTDRVLAHERPGYAVFLGFTKRAGLESVRNRVLNTVREKGWLPGQEAPAFFRTAMVEYPDDGREAGALADLLAQRFQDQPLDIRKGLEAVAHLR